MSTILKKGQLVLRKYGSGKTVKSRVAIVAKNSRTNYGIDVKKSNGVIQHNAYGYDTFEECRKRLLGQIEATNEQLTAQYKRLELLNELEVKGKEVFGIKETTCTSTPDNLTTQSKSMSAEDR